MTPSQIEALIQLLEDPDEQIFEQVKQKIIELGVPLLDDLELAWETTTDTQYQERIENITATIRLGELKNKVQLWLERNPNDLIQGAILIAKYQYPNINTGEIRTQLHNIEQAIWLELFQNLTALEKIHTFNQVFYNHFKFNSQIKDPHTPQHSLINITLGTKQGTPLIIGIIYLALAQRLNLPLKGISFPYLFALSHTNPTRPNTALFYINPASAGHIFSQLEVEAYLKRLELTPDLTNYPTISNPEIIRMLCLQLQDSYQHQNNHQSARAIQQLINLF